MLRITPKVKLPIRSKIMAKCLAVTAEDRGIGDSYTTGGYSDPMLSQGKAVQGKQPGRRVLKYRFNTLALLPFHCNRGRALYIDK